MMHQTVVLLHQVVQARRITGLRLVKQGSI
jgi:hypothetical protein